MQAPLSPGPDTSITIDLEREQRYDRYLNGVEGFNRHLIANLMDDIDETVMQLQRVRVQLEGLRHRARAQLEGLRRHIQFCSNVRYEPYNYAQTMLNGYPLTGPLTMTPTMNRNPLNRNVGALQNPIQNSGLIMRGTAPITINTTNNSTSSGCVNMTMVPIVGNQEENENENELDLTLRLQSKLFTC